MDICSDVYLFKIAKLILTAVFVDSGVKKSFLFDNGL